MRTTFTTIDDVIDHYILPSLLEHANCLSLGQLEDIARETFAYDAKLGVFVRVVPDEDFWDVVAQHLGDA